MVGVGGLSPGLLRAGIGKVVSLAFNEEDVLAEAGDGHADAILVLADPLDIVRRVARGIALERGECVEQRAEPVEADGGTVKWGKIIVSHSHILLEKRYGDCALFSSRAGEKRKPLGLAPRTDMGTVLAFVKRVSVLNIKEKYERSQRRKSSFWRAIFTSEPCGDVAPCTIRALAKGAA